MKLFDEIEKSEHYGYLVETIYPDETGLSVPINVHLKGEFVNWNFPVIKVKLSPIIKRGDTDWEPVILMEKIIYSNKISKELILELEEFLTLNNDVIKKYWEYIPNVVFRDLITKI